MGLGKYFLGASLIFALTTHCGKKQEHQEPIIKTTTKTDTVRPNIDEILQTTHTEKIPWKGVESSVAIAYKAEEGDNVWSIIARAIGGFKSKKLFHIKTTTKTYPNNPDSNTTKTDTVVYPISGVGNNKEIVDLMLKTRIFDPETGNTYLSWERPLYPGEYVVIPYYDLLSASERHDIARK